MIPRRFINWILIWTPITWLVLAALHVPEGPPGHHRPADLPPGRSAHREPGSSTIGGFFDPAVASYPAWVMVSLAVIAFAAGAVGLIRHSKARTMNLLLLAMGAVFTVWALDAGGWGDWQARSRLGENALGVPDRRGRARRPVRVLLGARQPRARYADDLEHPPGLDAVPRQLAGHARPLHHAVLLAHGAARALPRRPHDARPQLAGRRPVRAALVALLPVVGHRPGRPVDPCGVHLERAHLAGRRSARDGDQHHPRCRHRHRRRLLRGLAERGVDAAHRRLPRDPLAAAGHGPGLPPGGRTSG